MEESVTPVTDRVALNLLSETMHVSRPVATQHLFPGVEHHGGGPAGGGCASGCGFLVSAVQLHLLSGVEGEESDGVSEQQPEAV